jgi:hypothetical protein
LIFKVDLIVTRILVLVKLSSLCVDPEGFIKGFLVQAIIWMVNDTDWECNTVTLAYLEETRVLNETPELVAN